MHQLGEVVEVDEKSPIKFRDLMLVRAEQTSDLGADGHNDKFRLWHGEKGFLCLGGLTSGAQSASNLISIGTTQVVPFPELMRIPISARVSAYPDMSLFQFVHYRGRSEIASLRDAAMSLRAPSTRAAHIATKKYDAATSTRLARAHWVATAIGVPKMVSAPTPASSFMPIPPGVSAITDAKITTGIVAAICQRGICNPMAFAVSIDIKTTTQKRPTESITKRLARRAFRAAECWSSPKVRKIRLPGVAPLEL